MNDIYWDDNSDIDNQLEISKYENLQSFKQILEKKNNNKKETWNTNNQRNWRNLLFWEDNLNVLYYLLNDHEEKVDLIYIDPPFFSGVNYNIGIQENGIEKETLAYGDTWQKDLNKYLGMLNRRIYLMRKLLKKEGLIFIHSDWHAVHYIRILLDRIFGPERFVNEIIWYYYNKYSAGKKTLPRAHDNILVYSKSNDYALNEIRIPRQKPTKQLKRVMVDGVLKNAKDEKGHVIYRIVNDKKMDDVWKLPCLQPASKEFTGYPTQKHHDLIKRIITLGSNEGDLVADFFCGSGTTLLVAEQLNRRWIGSDLSKYAIYLTRKRLLKLYNKERNSLQNSCFFEIFSTINEERKKIIDSGFFDKKFTIKKAR